MGFLWARANLLTDAAVGDRTLREQMRDVCPPAHAALEKQKQRRMGVRRVSCHLIRGESVSQRR